MLKNFFSKLELSRKEQRWLETLGNIGIFPINLKPGNIHVLGDALSRAPHIASMRWRFRLETLTPLSEGMEMEDPVKNNQVSNLMPLFERDGKRLL